MNDLVKKADAFAAKAHEGQTDKAGLPYITHPRAVAAMIEDETAKVAALLHDTVEDTDVTLEEIRAEFGDEIAAAVDLLTHRPGVDVSSSRCAVFEGFFDYLSWLAWRKVEEPGMDVCVLNSTSLIAYARSWVLSHDVVRSFFDNDPAGDKATEALAAWCAEEGKDFRDGRGAYVGKDDVNEAWCEALSTVRRASVDAGRSRNIHHTFIS